MRTKQDALFQQGLYSLGMTTERESFFHLLSLPFIGHPEVLKDCLLTYLNREPHYTYQPIIGAGLTFDFHYESQEVSIQRLEETWILPLSLFIQFLRLVDLVYGVIYPIGTVVELDRNLLSSDLVARFEQAEVDMLVSLVGRRVHMKASGVYVDYVGYMQPYGLTYDQEPLFISHLFIKRVLSEGYRGATDDAYCFEELRQSYLEMGIYSGLYEEGVSYEN